MVLARHHQIPADKGECGGMAGLHSAFISEGGTGPRTDPERALRSNATNERGPVHRLRGEVSALSVHGLRRQIPRPRRMAASPETARHHRVQRHGDNRACQHTAGNYRQPTGDRRPRLARHPIDGGDDMLNGVQGVQVMTVASGATLNLNRLTI